MFTKQILAELVFEISFVYKPCYYVKIVKHVNIFVINNMAYENENVV